MTTPNTVEDDFEAWWEQEGRFYDPDFSDVSWYDKRKFLAQKAFIDGRKGVNLGK